MSWSVSIPKTPRETIAQAITSAELPPDTYNKPELVEQWRKRLEAAKDAACTILVSGGAFGDDGIYSVSMTGHAAHGGLAESSGYTSSEFIHVTVSWEPKELQAQ